MEYSSSLLDVFFIFDSFPLYFSTIGSTPDGLPIPDTR